MLDTFYLANGLYYTKQELARLTRKKRFILVLVLVGLCLSLYGAVIASNHYSRMSIDVGIYESYRKVVLDAMNGDAKFKVGNELFECKGGYIGNV